MGLDGVGQLSLAISAGATILSLTAFIGFTFYPYISNKAINDKNIAYKKTRKLSNSYFFININSFYISSTEISFKIILIFIHSQLTLLIFFLLS